MINFKAELDTNLKADIPVIAVITTEWLRLHGACIRESKTLHKTFFRWSCTSGLEKWDDEEKEFKESDNSKKDPMEIIEWFKEPEQKNIILLLEDFHPFLTPENFQIIRILRETIRISNDIFKKSIILQLPYNVDLLELKQEVPYLELNLPDEDIIITLLEESTKNLDFDYRPNTDDVSSIEVESTFKRIIVQKSQLTRSEIPLLIKEKEQLIKKEGILEYYSPQGNFNQVGGLNNLKKWLTNRGQSFTNDAKEYGLTFPKGVLLLGIPGCGKSLVSKTIADEWDLPLLKFDLGKVFGGIVGQSEANIRKALSLAETIAPSILWIDEIEKGLSGLNSGGDSGTSSRVFGTLLTWMQDKKSNVFVIATANNIEMLPPELLRKGRFDEIFFVDLPSEEERKEIFKIHIKNKNRSPEDFDLNILSKKSKGYSGSEIEESINEGLYLSFADNTELSNKYILTALEETYPLSKTMGKTITNLRKWANVRARFASSSQPDKLENDEKDLPTLKQERNNPFA